VSELTEPQLRALTERCVECGSPPNYRRSIDGVGFCQRIHLHPSGVIRDCVFSDRGREVLADA
jgi:hypothetical protein